MEISNGCSRRSNDSNCSQPSDHAVAKEFTQHPNSKSKRPDPFTPFLAPFVVRVWAFPNTLIGLVVGYAGVLSGGHCKRVEGCWEFHGNVVKWFLERMPTGCGASAMTLGHVIWGQSIEALDFAREHEHVHVRQYEKWGPIFIPAYLIASLIAWLRGRDPYRDNVFEVEAYTRAPCEYSNE